jgi:hypothetical protein
MPVSRNRDIATILGRSEAANASNTALGTGSGGGGGGATSYDSAGALPTSGNTAGDLAFTTNKKALYNWDGAEWDRIYSGPNETLTWDSALPASIGLKGSRRLEGSGDSAQTVLEFSAAADTEGFPVTYSYQMIPPYPVQLDSAFGDDSASGGKGLIDSSDHPTRPRITLLPSAVVADEGDFIFRVKATDGTHVITSSSTLNLAFLPQMDNLSLLYDFRSTSSFSVATAVTDISTYGNTNNGTITSGSIDTSGPGSTRGLGFTTSTRMLASTAASIGNARTVMHIMTRPADSLVLNSTGNSSYLGVIKSGDTAGLTSGISAEGGYTANININGNNGGFNRSTAYATMDGTAFNSWTFRGYNLTNYNLRYNYYGGEWYSSFIMQALLIWDVYLTDAELRDAHNYFDNMATWVGV